MQGDYFLLHISRFSNNTGSSLIEATLLTQLPVFLNYLTVGCLLLRSTLNTENLYRLTFEFLSIILPLILILTLTTYLLCAFYIFLAFIIFLTVFHIKKNRTSCWKSFQSNVIIDEKLSCITVFRATINVYTVVCILAADFTCFPQRFLKTKSYGYGLMDTGVGLFAVIYSFSDSPFKQRRFIIHTIYKILPLFVLGIGRFLLTSAVNYQHQVTEYGTQWNFFVTLFTITLINEILLRFIKSIRGVIVAIVLFSVIHESVLTLGLKDWILSDASRNDFISGNREGIFSLLGYEILYLCGMLIKNYLPKKNDTFQKYITIVPKYLIGFISCFTLTKLAELSVGVSRRTANSGYILWILSITFLSLICIIFCETIFCIFAGSKNNCAHSVSLIMKSVNYNGLVFFLFGNILTGVININMKTLHVSDTYGILIISLYMFICCGFNVFLYRKNIRWR